MSNNKGWVKLYRDQFNNWISKKPYCDGYAWTYLYSQANHKKGMVNFRNEYIEIERGQLLTSKLKLKKIFKWTRRHLKNFLTALEKDQMLTYRVTNRFMVITIVKYSIYQGDTSKSDIQSDQQVTNRRHTDDIQVSTNKNEENDKNVNNVKNINIYSIWNNQKIIVHESIKPFESAIKIALDKYAEKDIITAIKNYSFIVNSSDYYYDHKYPINKFLTITAKTNHIEEFKNLEIAKNNYKKGGNNGKSKGYNKPDTSGSKGSTKDKYKRLEETYEV